MGKTRLSWFAICRRRCRYYYRRNCFFGGGGIVAVFSIGFADGVFVYLGMESANRHTRRPSRRIGRLWRFAGCVGNAFDNRYRNGGCFSNRFIIGDIFVRVCQPQNAQQNKTDDRNARRNADCGLWFFCRGYFIAVVARTRRIAGGGYRR